MQNHGNQSIFNIHNVYEASPAMPTNSHQRPTMAPAQGPVPSQQGAPESIPWSFAGHFSRDASQRCSINNTPIPNQAGALAPAHGNAQAPQPESEQGFGFAQQQLPATARYLVRNIARDPAAIDGLLQFCSALSRQPGIRDWLLGLPDQQPQQGQGLAVHGEAPQTPDDNPENIQGVDQGHHTEVSPSPKASSPSEAGYASNFGTPVAGPAPPASAISRDFQSRVDRLVAEPATTFMGHIQNEDELALYENAVWKARRREKDIGNKCQGYPDNDIGKRHITQRIFYAIRNLGGEQDPASDRGELKDSVAVRTVQALSDLEIEILAYKLMECMRKVQCGESLLHLPAESKLVQEVSFTDKLNQVVQALSYNKLLCRSATMTAEWIARIAADPVSERQKKNSNNKNNKDKANALRKDAAARGKTRGKGKKRSAPDDTEADSTRESTADVPESVHSGGPSSKRRRISQTQTQTQAQAQAQAQAQTHGEAPQQAQGQRVKAPSPQLFQPINRQLFPSIEQPGQAYQPRNFNLGGASASGHANNPATNTAGLTHTHDATYMAPPLVTTPPTHPANLPSEHTGFPNIKNTPGSMGMDGHSTSSRSEDDPTAAFTGQSEFDAPLELEDGHFPRWDEDPSAAYDFLTPYGQQQPGQSLQALQNEPPAGQQQQQQQQATGGAAPQPAPPSDGTLCDDDGFLNMLEPVAWWNAQN